MSRIDPAPVAPAQIPRAAEILTAALTGHEPFIAWALPDPERRLTLTRELVEADLRERFTVAGEAWMLGDVAVALWIPPEGAPGAEMFASRRSDSDLARYGEMSTAVAESDRLIAALRPTEPHWYLDTLATDPSRFGNGFGGALLDFCLARRDSSGDGLACVLDTHTALNVQLYARRGFDVIAEATTPADGPPLWIMRREAVQRPSQS